MNVRDDALGQVVSRAIVVAIGATSIGNREVLGLDIGDSEDETFWVHTARRRVVGILDGWPGTDALLNAYRHTALIT